MTEAAATAIGIAGIVGVLQSLLQCYRDFLTARDFGNDYAYLQVRAALLENSTTTWAIAVGLLDESGAPRNRFLVARPTEQNVGLVQATLRLVREQLDAANAELAAYTSDAPMSRDNAGLETPAAATVGVAGVVGRPSNMRRAADKLYRMAHRQHDAQHPGTLKRTVWALVDKARLDGALNKVTVLMDRLNADFAPVDQKRQLDRYCQGIKDLELSPDELREVRDFARDRLSQRALQMLENERVTGNRFHGMQVTKDGTVNIGDHYDENWTGGCVAVSRTGDVYENVSVTDTAFVNIGNTFGGKSPVQIRLEQLQASRQARHGW